MIATAAAVLAASLAGSPHCLGMCGPFCAVATAPPGEGAPAELRVRGRPVRRGWFAPHAAYHAGRLATYTALGALAGTLGAAVDLTGSALGFSRAAAVTAGATMVLMGLRSLRHRRTAHFSRWPMPRWARDGLHRGHRAAQKLPPVARSGLIGIMTTLLPCGWLYSFAIVAAGTGGTITGIAIMTAFWLGTLPALGAMGLTLHGLLLPGLISGAARRWTWLARSTPTAATVLLIATGLWAIAGRIPVPGRVSEAGSEHATCCHTRAATP